MTERTLPPLCPNCSKNTGFKEMHKLSKGDGFMCFFWCESCALEYPLAFGSADPALARLKTVARKRPATDPRE